MQVIKQLKKLPARKTKKHQHAHFIYEKILNKTGCSEVIKKDKLNKTEKKKLLLHRNRYYKQSINKKQIWKNTCNIKNEQKINAKKNSYRLTEEQFMEKWTKDIQRQFRKE